MSRLHPTVRKELILSEAVTLALKLGYSKVTRQHVADAAGISNGLVNHHFGTMGQLHRDIMRYAVANEVLQVIAQGLAVGDPHAKKATEDLKLRAMTFIINQK